MWLCALAIHISTQPPAYMFLMHVSANCSYGKFVSPYFCFLLNLKSILYRNIEPLCFDFQFYYVKTLRLRSRIDYMIDLSGDIKYPQVSIKLMLSWHLKNVEMWLLVSHREHYLSPICCTSTIPSFSWQESARISYAYLNILKHCTSTDMKHTRKFTSIGCRNEWCRRWAA